MVYLNRIYTKTGDDGQTSLGDGSRVAKTSVRIAAFGGVDELNCVIGSVLQSRLTEDLRTPLTAIQHDLFDIGADLCVPIAENEATAEHPPLRVTAQQVSQLETWIDAINEPLSELTSFVLPGGTDAATRLHLARTVCRRIEIGVLTLAAEESVNPHVAVYLNRLSDLLFVMARAANNKGKGDVLWIPGKNRK